MRLKISLLLAAIFLIFGVLTLPRYGINWDTINHLTRGQTYLHYFLTGESDYSSLQNREKETYWQKPESLGIDSNIPIEKVPTRSLYQSDGTPLSHFLKYDGDGHPPLSDIFSSAFNMILFQKLRVINDIDSYRVYGIFLSSILVGLIFYWVSSLYGKFAGFVSTLSLALYPLFWSESHFNTEKDIPETVFWGLMLYLIWRGCDRKNAKSILLSGVIFGFALGTKFNVMFIPLVIIPWLIFFAYKNTWLKSPASFINKHKQFLLSWLIAPVIGVTIFILSWPYLWQDLVFGLQRVFGFYKSIGTTQNFDERYLIFGDINIYPGYWILLTTPIVILLLSLAGTIYAIKNIHKDKKGFLLLVLLWLLVPIIRASMPGANIYGGVRQIMEYIPAMSILAGIGSIALVKLGEKLKIKPSFSRVLILLLFIPILYKLVQIHPNENAYFNPIAGGLAGAKASDIPSWGNTFGAAYRQGVVWINNNAEENSNVVFAYELLPNIPKIWFRSDLNVHNSQRSAFLRKGEYVITLVYDGTEDRSYFDTYLERFLNPVYESKVDGVSVVKVWKNDSSHLKRSVEEEVDKNIILNKVDSRMQFDLGELRNLSRLEIEYDEMNCKKMKSGILRISKNSQVWDTPSGALPDDWRVPALGEQPSEGKFIEPFVGQEARYIELSLEPKDACPSSVLDFKVFYFK